MKYQTQSSQSLFSNISKNSGLCLEASSNEYYQVKNIIKCQGVLSSIKEYYKVPRSIVKYQRIL
jgi:hypothetical protein